MRSLYVIYALVSGCCANSILQPTPSTSDPTITPAPEVPIELLRKQNGNRFMGWIQIQSKWTTRQCDVGGTLYQNGDFWRCCATTIASCNVPVGCVSGSLIYSFETGTQSLGTYACSSVYTDPGDSSFTLCNTGFLFENTLDSNPQTNIFCGRSAVNWSYYRVKPEESSTESSSSSLSSSPRSASASVTSSSASSTSTGAPISDPEEPPVRTEKKESKAWIAGAVVGPIVAIAIAGFLVWFCLRRHPKKSTKTTPQGAPTVASSSYPASPDQTMQQQPYYPPMQQNHDPNQPGFVPYGVGVGPHEQKHQSFFAPPPHSPHTQGSTSPNMPPTSPYAPPQQYQQQQQWQSAQPPASPQMLGGELNHPPQGYLQPSPPMSPMAQHQHAGADAIYQNENPNQARYDESGRPFLSDYENGNQRPFSNELDGRPYQQPMPPQQGQH